jgi:hypothetical protein
MLMCCNFISQPAASLGTSGLVRPPAGLGTSGRIGRIGSWWQDGKMAGIWGPGAVQVVGRRYVTMAGCFHHLASKSNHTHLQLCRFARSLVDNEQHKQLISTIKKWDTNATVKHCIVLLGVGGAIRKEVDRPLYIDLRVRGQPLETLLCKLTFSRYKQ